MFNSLPQDALLSYLPLGSGCALHHALGFPPQIIRIAKRICEGRSMRTI